MVERVSEGAVTSPIFRIRGQKSRWRYPDPRVSPENCEILRDVNLSERGTADSRYGYALYNSTQLAGSEAAVGLAEVTLPSGTVRRIVITPTAVYNDDGTTRTTITGTALTGGVDNRARILFAKGQVIFNNGYDAPRVWSGALGSTTADLATVPWSKVTDIMIHKNLLFALGTTEGGTYYPTRIRWCDVDWDSYTVDINTWPTANRYEVYDGGPELVGGVEAWGIAMIFKKDGVYPGQIVFDSTGHYDFELGQPLRGFSPISTLSIVSRPEFVFAAAKEGLVVIRSGMEFEVVNSDDVTTWLGLNKARWQYSQAFIRETDHQVRLLCSSVTNSSSHDRVLVWDWETGDTWLDRPSKVITYANSITVSSQELDWFCSGDGYLYTGNKSTYIDDAGTGFNWQIKMHPNDLGLPGKSKHVLNVKTIYRRRSRAQDITLRVHIDEGREAYVRNVLDVSSPYKWSSGLGWGSGLRWPTSGTLISDTFVNRICSTISPEWSSDSPAIIEGYQVEFVPLEE